MKPKQKNISGKDGFDLGIGGLGSGFGGAMFKGPSGREDRLVARYGEDDDDLVIDTCFAKATGCFETGIIDVRYQKDRDWIIVGEYETKKETKKEHKKWVKLLTGKKLPKELRDVHTNEVYKLN